MKYRELRAVRVPWPMWEALVAEQQALTADRIRLAQPPPPASERDFALVLIEKGLRAFAAERVARQREIRKDALVKLPSELAGR